ncbi:ubiquitin-conjugating enzyme E2 Z-like [Dermacentor andersoni]|uniref:ubiquitin-conjugating enzyme E2 Z-like n=1 Tax=Dermacentor andersoni TaxID=34620 RepID=UPI002155AAF5|nr:ubiquitin-conjugating enzyme E2 Z-like [Dermacentor andersoni]
MNLAGTYGSSKLPYVLDQDVWDPISHEHEEPTPLCLARVKREIAYIYARPPHGIFIEPEEDNITKMHALIVGPPNTPCEGGFFHFLVKCPPNYPVSPPRVRVMTTDAGRVRFNPNFYACGEVCLGVLGTWPGPSWNATQNVETVLISIQSLMSEKPYFNEVGYDRERRPGDASRYNAVIRHETIRVAVCDAVEACLVGSSACPPALRRRILRAFPEYCDRYEKLVGDQMHLNGTAMMDPFGHHKGVYQHRRLLQLLQRLKEQLSWTGPIPEGKEDAAQSTVESPSLCTSDRN